MNKRDRQELKESIARDLEQGQGEHSPTKELLKQYAPLEGVVTLPESKSRHRPGLALVEKSLAPAATVVQTSGSAWHDATGVPDATLASRAIVEQFAIVKGELRVPNTINFSLFPTLDPFAKAVYYQLFLLSHGFKRDTCIVGLSKLSKSVMMSQRKVQDTINYLEKRGLIKRLRAILGGPMKGNVYQVFLPSTKAASDSYMACDASVEDDATMASDASLAPPTAAAVDATNKCDDDNIKIKSSSKAQKFNEEDSVKNHREGAAPRVRKSAVENDYLLVRAAYEKATGNRWNKSDSQAYKEHAIERVPAERIIPVLEAVVRRTPAKINSFKYFVKEILAISHTRHRAWQKKHLEKIVTRIRDNSVGRKGYSMSDFVEDVKCACAREGVTFDNDTFNELVG
jgi:hypothetical protein